LGNKKDIDFSDLVLSEYDDDQEINPEVAGVEPLHDDLIPCYNPFTKEFEEVPANWKLKLDPKTGEWHYRPGV